MEITIKIDQRSKQAKAFYEYLKSLPFVKVEERELNKVTKEAMEEVKNGKATKVSLDQFRKQLY